MNNNLKILDTFSGQYFMSNHDVISECLANNTKPDDFYFCISKITLIENADTKAKYFIGEFEGDADGGPFSFKIFIYEKDHSALGKFSYPAEANYSPESINAKYNKLENGNYIIYGYSINNRSQGKEGLLFYVEKQNDTKGIISASKPEISSGIHSNSPNNPKRSSKKSKKENTITEKADFDTGLFKSVNAAQNKQASVFFIAYMLTKLNMDVSLPQEKKNAPDILVSQQGKPFYINVYASIKSKPSWNIDKGKINIKHYFIFVHSISTDVFPDVYIAKGSQLKRWITDNGKIETTYPGMIKIKNSWDYFR